jgi:ubiquinone/menaquinone biosynthesis C-methylase UbiE
LNLRQRKLKINLPRIGRSKKDNNKTVAAAHDSASVAEHYDKVWTEQEDESWYSWQFFRQQPSAIDFALNSLGDVRGRKVLDLACGLGESTLRLAERGAQVMAVDFSAQGIAKTRARVDAAGVGERVTTLQASVEDLPLEPESYDLVFAQNFLMHVSAAKVGQEVWRVLKPGGKAVFIEPLSHHPVVKIYRRFFSGYKGTRPRWTTHHDLAELARPFHRAHTRTFYLAAALASVGFVQKRRFLLKTSFRVLNTIDSALLKVAPATERYAWIAVTELVKH